ncbi:MAG: hypothetical protein K8S13_17415 [Desulfobacula sp.]|uniref:hypothetical protein n=1 Tax=Desulfobacula sp. TaxID=2593537 RepID=UPI0025BFC894|nr:hypothetical protein [Desulfobacula sp.]MCD4721619.1 hypothetical protein [Desulfobacula sp.]
MTIEIRLANNCIRFYNATNSLSLHSRASTREDFERLIRRGYSFVAGSHPIYVTTFLQTACVASWGELNRASRNFSQRASLGANAHFGTRDFLGASWRISQMDRRIGGSGLGSRAPTPEVSNGFDSISTREKDHAIILAEAWRTTAIRVPDHADFNDVDDAMKIFYREQINAAKTFYEAAVNSLTGIPQSARRLYIGYLRGQPSDIWGGYKTAIFPAQRQMAARLSFAILRGYDPYSNSPPPSSPLGSILGTAWDSVEQLLP